MCIHSAAAVLEISRVDLENIICYSVGIIHQTQLLQFTGVYICISNYMFRPLIWPSSGYLMGVYFLFTLLYLQYTYIYTTTRPVIRDLLFCSTGK
jgi:hypothetical protein